MGAQRSTFGKLERDRAKKAKAAAKRERRLERKADAATPADDVTAGAHNDPPGGISAADLLAEIELTHQRFEAGDIGYDEFEEKKAELFSRLPID